MRDGVACFQAGLRNCSDSVHDVPDHTGSASEKRSYLIKCVCVRAPCQQLLRSVQVPERGREMERCPFELPCENNHCPQLYTIP